MAKHRKSHRRSTKRRHSRRKTHRMRGGATDLSPANVGSFTLGGKDLPQGGQFLQMHVGQHGGANTFPNVLRNTLQMGGAAPLSTMGQPLLTGPQTIAARTDVINQQFAQIAGMKDQAGGRRRRRGRKGKKTHRRSRKMRGGSLVLTPAEVGWKEAVAVPQGVNPQFASWDSSA